MQVLNRVGIRELLDLNKITSRIRELSEGLSTDYHRIAILTVGNLIDGISTTKIDDIAASICHDLISVSHPDHAILASRLSVSNLHKNTTDSFTEAMLTYSKDTGRFDPSTLDFIVRNRERLDGAVVHRRDYLFAYNSFRMLLDKKYLLRTLDDKVMERPQYLIMRMAIATSLRTDQSEEKNLEDIEEAYYYMSEQYYTHATPTMHNSCLKDQQLGSCFLMQVEDSVEGIMKGLTDFAIISKHCGGVGIGFSDIRSAGAIIKSSGGKSGGVCPQLQQFNASMNCWKQGDKRNGACAVFLEEWHGDFNRWLTLRSSTKSEKNSASDLFYGAWINDLFMKRLKEKKRYTLFSPDTAPYLSEVYDGMLVCTHCGWSHSPGYRKVYSTVFHDARVKGDEPLDCKHEFKMVKAFTHLYEHYENGGKGVGTVDPVQVVENIAEMRLETGVPYVGFKDNVNRTSLQSQLGSVKSSNLCVAPETMILTDQGQFPIVDLAGRKVNVWNGKEWSEVTPVRTGTNQKLVRVNLSNGVTIDCTPYHKFYLQDGKKVRVKEAVQLASGDKLIKYELPTIKDGATDFKYPYTHGLFCADGTYEGIFGEKRQCSFRSVTGDRFCSRHQYQKCIDEGGEPTEIYCATVNEPMPRITLYHEKIALLPYIVARLPPAPENDRKVNVRLPMDIAPKYDVPLNCDIKTKLEWFAGYCDGDGTVARNGTNQSLQCGSIDKQFLLNIRLMLQTMGVDSKVTQMCTAGDRPLPDSDRNPKLYPCQASYRLLVSSIGTQILLGLGFNTHRLILERDVPQRDASHFIKVVSVEDIGRVSDTYCFMEPKRSMGMFNGLLTSQCHEVVQVSTPQNYSSCTLGNIALSRFVKDGKFDYELLVKVAGIITKRLDNVIDANVYPVKECIAYAHDYRSIGIGMQGLANTFVDLGLEFDSEEAARVDYAITESIYYGAVTESNKLAVERGPFRDWNKTPLAEGKLHQDIWLDNQRYLGNGDAIPYSGMYDWKSLKESVKEKGLRNNHLVALAPTVSTSLFLGNNDSFEPFTQNIGTMDTLSGRHIAITKGLAERLQAAGLWTPEVRDAIISNNGSLAKIPGLEKIARLFKTAWDIKQKVLMKRASMRGAFVDQAQSMNLFFTNPSIKMLVNSFVDAHQMGLPTGSYYTRTRAAAAPMKISTIGAHIQEYKTCRRDNPDCDACA